jgi:hypothetical protein
LVAEAVDTSIAMVNLASDNRAFRIALAEEAYWEVVGSN